ncbi:MAG TPA: DUF1552 domain-containing protein [Pirellulales bacterium]|nr:DUF1552 domain-containing protein [Pirellulales bacterium]
MRSKVSRRVVLQGLGATVALPWLESARLLAADRDAADGAPPKRFAFLFFGDGIHPPEWWAKGTGAAMELGPAFASLAPLKQKVNFINGLAHSGEVVGGHARGAAGILTGVQPKGGREIRAETSMDQLLAQRLGDATVLPSLVLACERPVSGFHESGYSMMYSSHVSWSSPVSPVPSELYPSLAFDSLFESQASRTHLSVLDHVLEQLGDVTRRASNTDRARIDEFATSVREVEQRLVKLEESQRESYGVSKSVKDQRPIDGLPTQIDEHTRLMSDVIALAFQNDRTRIATMLLTNNLSGQVYPFLGLRDDHHSFSHNWQGQDFAKITRFWVEQYAYLLAKLDAVQEGDGSVLDHSCVILANEQWTAHNAPKIPLLMAGGLNGAFETGRSLDFEASRDRKMSALYLAIMDRMGVTLPKFGDASEPLTI